MNETHVYTGPHTTIAGHMPSTLANQFVALARANERTISAELRRAVKRHLAAEIRRA